MSKVKFKRILFDAEEFNKPMKCYQVGLLGCKSIIENHFGYSGGIEVCNYTVEFEDGSSITIDNTFYVTDGSTDGSTAIVNYSESTGESS